MLKHKTPERQAGDETRNEGSRHETSALAVEEMEFLEMNRRAASDIHRLLGKLNLLGDRIADVEDLIRQKRQTPD